MKPPAPNRPASRGDGNAFDAATNYLNRLNQMNVAMRIIIPAGLACWVGYGMASVALHQAIADVLRDAETLTVPAVPDDAEGSATVVTPDSAQFASN